MVGLGDIGCVMYSLLCRRGQNHCHFDVVGYVTCNGGNGEGVWTGHLRGDASNPQHDGGVSPIRHIMGQFDGYVPIAGITV